MKNFSHTVQSDFAMRQKMCKSNRNGAIRAMARITLLSFYKGKIIVISINSGELRSEVREAEAVLEAHKRRQHSNNGALKTVTHILSR